MCVSLGKNINFGLWQCMSLVGAVHTTRLGKRRIVFDINTLHPSLRSRLLHPTANTSKKPINFPSYSNSTKPSQNTIISLPVMSIFKFNKNKTASAATTPAQTPRSSMQTARPALTQANVMTREQALESLMKKTAGTTSFNYLH